MNLQSIPTTKPRTNVPTTRPPSLQKADPKNILGSGRLHPVLTQKVERLIEKADAEGLSLRLVEGFRSMERQAQLAADPKGVTSAKPGYSFHNYGLAVDVAFRDIKGNPSWAMTNDWQRLGRLGKEVGLSWGGDWKRFDGPHFQLVPNQDLATVRRLTEEVGMEKMWEKIR